MVQVVRGIDLGMEDEKVRRLLTNSGELLTSPVEIPSGCLSETICCRRCAIASSTSTTYSSNTRSSTAARTTSSSSTWRFLYCHEGVYNATGVPSDRMKVMIKGGVLKGRFIIIWR